MLKMLDQNVNFIDNLIPAIDVLLKEIAYELVILEDCNAPMRNQDSIFQVRTGSIRSYQKYL